MLCRVVLAVLFDNYTENKNTLCGQNAEILLLKYTVWAECRDLIVKTDGTHRNHEALNGTVQDQIM